MKNYLLVGFFILASQFLFSQNSQFAGIYKCSDEDLIRLNADGTGKLVISYFYDGVLPFTWKYKNDEKIVSVELLLTEEQKYEIPNRYLTLHYLIDRGKQILSHYTSGPTFYYIKQ